MGASGDNLATLRTTILTAFGMILAIAGGAAAQPADANEVSVPVSAGFDFFSATDAYAGLVTDTCTLTSGFPLVVGSSNEAIGTPTTIIVAGHEIHVVDPTISAIPYWGGAEIDWVDGSGGGGDPPICCACGIISYDPSTGEVKLKGCAAITKPCCCTATISSSGTIKCYCVGGSTKCFG